MVSEPNEIVSLDIIDCRLYNTTEIDYILVRINSCCCFNIFSKLTKFFIKVSMKCSYPKLKKLMQSQKTCSSIKTNTYVLSLSSEIFFNLPRSFNTTLSLVDALCQAKVKYCAINHLWVNSLSIIPSPFHYFLSIARLAHLIKDTAHNYNRTILMSSLLYISKALSSCFSISPPLSESAVKCPISSLKALLVCTSQKHKQQAHMLSYNLLSQSFGQIQLTVGTEREAEKKCNWRNANTKSSIFRYTLCFIAGVLWLLYFTSAHLNFINDVAVYIDHACIQANFEIYLFSRVAQNLWNLWNLEPSKNWLHVYGTTFTETFDSH